MTCPYCGQDFKLHRGELCPVLDAAMTKQIRAVVQFLQNERDVQVKQLALSSAITPRMYALDNVDANKSAQQILSFNMARGCALVYNDDNADVWLGEDRQHIGDPTKQFLLKTKVALVITSPNELWALGNAAGPQKVYVLELPGGRQSAELAALAKIA